MKSYNNLKKILVTGGAGYVGAVLIPKLLKKGYQAVVLDWFIYGNPFNHIKEKRLKLVKGDIRDTKLLKKELKGMDAVIHLASISNDPSYELNPILGKSVNFDATKNLADISKKSGVKRFIFASTSSVYGVKKEIKVMEDLPLEPLTDYSKYKALGEKYILSLADQNFTVLVLRPATVCGYSPRMRLDLSVNMLTIQALVNKKITVFGGNQMRPNIHIEDVTDLYVKSLEYPEEKIQGQVFNAGYENISIINISKMIKKVLKEQKIKIVISPANDNRSYRIDSTKIRKILGFKPRHTVKEAILDIKKAFDQGQLDNPIADSKYYNIKTMTALKDLLI